MPSAGQSCAHGKLCLNLELRTWLPLPSPASESDALMSFFSSPSCSHVIFVWVYIIIVISVPSPISIAPLHTWHLGCDLLRSVMFSFLAKQSVCEYMIYNSTTSALMYHSSAHLIQEPFFPPGLLQSQATKDDGSNRWSKCYAHLAIICEPTAPAIAYGLGINVLIFDLPLQARLLMSLILEKKLGWDGPME